MSGLVHHRATKSRSVTGSRATWSWSLQGYYDGKLLDLPRRQIRTPQFVAAIDVNAPKIAQTSRAATDS